MCKEMIIRICITSDFLSKWLKVFLYLIQPGIVLTIGPSKYIFLEELAAAPYIKQEKKNETSSVQSLTKITTGHG